METIENAIALHDEWFRWAKKANDLYWRLHKSADDLSGFLNYVAGEMDNEERFQHWREKCLVGGMEDAISFLIALESGNRFDDGEEVMSQKEFEASERKTKSKSKQQRRIVAK